MGKQTFEISDTVKLLKTTLQARVGTVLTKQ